MLYILHKVNTSIIVHYHLQIWWWRHVWAVLFYLWTYLASQNTAVTSALEDCSVEVSQLTTVYGGPETIMGSIDN